MLNSPLQGQHPFTVIEEDFTLTEKKGEDGSTFEFADQCQGGLPMVELLLVNCIMSYIEHSLLSFGSLIGELCLQRRTVLMRNQLIYGGWHIDPQQQQVVDAHNKQYDETHPTTDSVLKDRFGDAIFCKSEISLSAFDQAKLKLAGYEGQLYTSTRLYIYPGVMEQKQCQISLTSVFGPNGIKVDHRLGGKVNG